MKTNTITNVKEVCCDFLLCIVLLLMLWIQVNVDLILVHFGAIEFAYSTKKGQPTSIVFSVPRSFLNLQNSAREHK